MTHHDLDVIIYATGFQALTGELMRMDIYGEGGRLATRALDRRAQDQPGDPVLGLPEHVRRARAAQPRHLLQHHPLCVENNVDWIVGCIRYMRENGYETVVTTAEAEEAWTQRCYDSLKGLLIEEMQDSWFFGTNNDENVRGHFLLFAGGVPLYRQIFADVAARGYEGFELR